MNGYRDGEYKECRFTPEFEGFGGRATDSLLYGGQLFNGNLINCTMSGFPIVSTLSARHTHISGHARVIGNTSIGRSVISDMAVVSGKAIYGSELYGNSMVLDEADVSFCILEDFAVVCGNAVVVGDVKNPMVLSGYTYIHTGLWLRPPRTEVAWKSGIIVSECKNGKVNVGCICNTPEKFLGGAGDRYGLMLGLNGDQLDEVREIVRNFKR